MATDIAFALGALNLIAPQAPIGAKVLLTALAIVDDMGAVLVISLFLFDRGSSGVRSGGAAVTLLVLIGFNLIGIRRLWPYLLLGVVLWYFLHASGVHATIAGVALAFIIPTRSRINAREFSREARSAAGSIQSHGNRRPCCFDKQRSTEAVFALDRASESVTAPVLRLEHALHNFSGVCGDAVVRVCECWGQN
jgi:NhaA family Na+:H+ antiporter